MSLAAAISDLLLQLGERRTYWVAYSGGLDSHVLLSLCHALRVTHPIKLRAIHINHQLSPNANAWSSHCARVCADFNIDYVEKRVDISVEQGESLEEVARNQRYAAFADCLQVDDVLLTAHHENDQAETLLLQLCRGAGPKGLAAMPVIKPFARGLKVRPLLGVSRTALEQYAKEHELVWVEDESNQQRHFARNFIRHEVLPLLNQRWPSIASTMSRSAAYCAEAQALLEEFAKEACVAVQGSKSHTLSVMRLLQTSAAKQRLILRVWIEQNGFRLPDANRLEAIRTTILTAACDRMPCVTWADAAVRRYRDDLFIMTESTEAFSLSSSWEWDMRHALSLPGIGILQAESGQGIGLRADLNQVSVRFRQGGEVAHTQGQVRHELKKLFQEWDVPTWERDRIPLLFVGDKLVSAVGYFIDADYAAKTEEDGMRVTLL